jgi:hypothetical protein
MIQVHREKKNVLKPSVHPTIKDIHWAAGFLEGEGCFGKSHNRKGSEFILVSQVHKDPIKKLQELFGGVVKLQKRPEVTKKDIFIWRVGGARARGIMLTIYSLMSNKSKKRIREALMGG